MISVQPQLWMNPNHLITRSWILVLMENERHGFMYTRSLSRCTAANQMHTQQLLLQNPEMNTTCQTLHFLDCMSKWICQGRVKNTHLNANACLNSRARSNKQCSWKKLIYLSSARTLCASSENAQHMWLKYSGSSQTYIPWSCLATEPWYQCQALLGDFCSNLRMHKLRLVLKLWLKC